MTRETLDSPPLMVVVVAVAESRRRGSFPSTERGTIFARWFALGETGGRVQVDAARVLVGARAPPLPLMPLRRHLVVPAQIRTAGSY